MFYFFGLFKLALTNLLIRKLNSALTILSLVLGSAAFLAILSSNEGSKKQLNKQMKDLGTDLIWINSSNYNKKLQSYDAQQLSKYSSYFKSVAYKSSLSGGSVKYKSKTSQGTVLGVSPEYRETAKLVVNKGRFFDSYDVQKKSFVAVIGATIQKDLFGDYLAVGKTVMLTIDQINYPFLIVGSLKMLGGSSSEVDGGFFVPDSVLPRLSKNISTTLIASLSDEEKSAQGKKFIKLFFEPKYGDQGIDTYDAAQLISQSKEMWSSLSTVGIVLAFITLVSGGIGIMNVMLLSIAQRRKEIGLRKALGASDFVILLQFLYEAVIISLLGAIIGIVIGLFAGMRIAQIMNVTESVVSAGPIVFSVFFSIMIGLVFGISPAMKASKLDPYEALRT